MAFQLIETVLCSKVVLYKQCPVNVDESSNECNCFVFLGIVKWSSCLDMELLVKIPKCWFTFGQVQCRISIFCCQFNSQIHMLSGNA